MSEGVENLSTGKMGNALTKKIGPLPGYMYVLIVILAYLLYRWYNSRQTSPMVAGYGLNSNETLATDPVSYGGGAAVVEQSGGNVSMQTNAQWARTAAQTLINLGVDASLATTAISKYLNGQHLSYEEKQAVDKALTTLGQPPEGVIPVDADSAPTVPQIPQTPAPAPIANGRWYTLQPGDTFESLATRYFGAADKASVLQQANVDTIGNWTAGQSVWIPGTTAAVHWYILQPGDTFESLATRFYGTADKASILADANKRTIGKWTAGQRVIIP